MLMLAVYILCLTLTDASSNFVNEKNSNIICQAKTCVPKCCSEKEHVIMIEKEGEDNEYKCLHRENDLDFPNIALYDDYEYDKKVDSKFSDLLILPNFKNFSTALDITEYEKERLTLSEKGRLLLEYPNNYERWKIFELDQYCIEYVASNKTPNEIELHYFVIYSDEGLHDNSSLNMAAMCVSCIFLVLVLLVYSLLPDLRNLGGKILMAYVLSLLLALLSLASIQINTYDSDTCQGITAVIYYAFLASFCWMNVMSYDIFWTFRGFAKARRIHNRGQNFKFLMYCLYAWGLPLAMTIMLVVMNNVDLTDKPWIVTPQIPNYGCFLMGGQKFVYLYIPMLILITCNCFFYLLTVFNIWRLSRQTAMLHSVEAGNASTHQEHKGRFMIYLKLSVVMGVNWLLEVLRFICPNSGALGRIPDIYNLLIGLLIFLIFVCKKKILQDIIAKFRSLQSQSPWFSNSEANTTNTSSLDTTSNQSPLKEEIPLVVSKHPDDSVQGQRYYVSV